MDAIVSYLQNSNPDIILLQEAYNGGNEISLERFRSMETLKQRLGMEFSAFAPAFSEITPFGEIDQGNGIISKFPLTPLDALFYDVPYGLREDANARADANHRLEYTPRNLQGAIAHVTRNESLAIFNTQGIWGTDGEDNPRRSSMIETIIEAASPYAHVIIGGDFNVKSTTSAMRKMGTIFTDSFSKNLKTTFNMKRKSNPLLSDAVVDFLFVGNALKIRNAICPDVDVSDHMPLEIMLTFNS